MPNDKLRDYLHLHFIVFIWGFTAVLGKLITIGALPLVWYRMLLATLMVFLFILFKKTSLKIFSRKILWTMLLGGVIIALHWVTFFLAIKLSTVTVALAAMSTGAFFTALLEPIWYGRKIIWYELLLGLIVIAGIGIIFKVEQGYAYGISLALISACLSAIFSLMNGKLIKNGRPSVISFYELGAGVLFLTVYLMVTGGFSKDFFLLSKNDWIFLFVLASVCTAYAFIASVKVMRHLSPFTVMLTINLEPVYGIVLAFVFLGEEEKMNPFFYLGGLVILSTVLVNGILKNRIALKKSGIR